MKILISEEQLQDRVRELGCQISRDYKGKELVIVGVLKGAFVFMADLMRAIDVPVRCEFIRVSSYQNDQSSGDVQINFDLTESIEGQDVLLLEDMVDTGRTLRFLIDHLKEKGAASVKIGTILYKEIDSELRPMIDYLGFTIPNDYVVGYGMDSEGRWRSLPHIATL